MIIFLGGGVGEGRGSMTPPKNVWRVSEVLPCENEIYNQRVGHSKHQVWRKEFSDGGTDSSDEGAKI